MRQRALDTEFNGFSEHEILEMLLFYALPRVNTNNIAHRLISEFGSLSAVLSAPAEQLEKVSGISGSSAVFISFFNRLCHMYASSVNTGNKFSSTDDLKKYFLDYFESNNSEICLIISVDTDFRLTNVRSYPTSFFTENKIPPRQLISTILNCKMERIVIGQNHPGKLPVPHDDDYFVTKLFAEAIKPLGIRFCDHIICGKNYAFSMREKSAFSFYD